MTSPPRPGDQTPADPDALPPEPADLDASAPDTADPDPAELDPADPDATAPEEPAPKTAGSDAADPEAADPDAPDAPAADPAVADPPAPPKQVGYTPSFATRFRNRYGKRLRRISRLVDRAEESAFRRAHRELLSADDLIAVRRSGRWMLLRTETEDSLPALRQRTATWIVGCLDAAGVEYFATGRPHETTVRLAVAADSWEPMLRAIQAGAPPAVYARLAPGRGVTPQATHGAQWCADPTTTDRLRDATDLQLFEHVGPGPEGPFISHQAAVELRQWGRDEHGALVARTPQPRIGHLGKDLQTPAVLQRGGLSIRTLAPFTETPVLEVGFPVDAVYLWVDGADPAWATRRAHVMAERTGQRALDLLGSSEARFRDNDELRHSLRSLEANAPWIRNVYLVTDDQRPDWLVSSHPRLTVVDHRDIFGDTGTLPTYNSHAIGARLHRIPGLAEHFLLINDDVFFGRPQRPELYFEASGLSRFFLSRTVAALADRGTRPAHEEARRNVIELLRRDYGVLVTNAFFHTPVPQRRSTLEALAERYPTEIERTIHAQFRSPDDLVVNSWLHHYWGYLNQRAIPGRIRYGYVNLGATDADTAFGQLLRKRDYDTFCINDTSEATEADQIRATQFLGEYFDQPSSFEVGR